KLQTWCGEYRAEHRNRQSPPWISVGIETAGCNRFSEAIARVETYSTGFPASLHSCVDADSQAAIIPITLRTQPGLMAIISERPHLKLVAGENPRIRSACGLLLVRSVIFVCGDSS